MCRAIEKPSNQVLETQISLLKKHVKDIEAKLLEKQVIEIQLRERVRKLERPPSTIPRAEVIDLVEPAPRANTSNLIDVYQICVDPMQDIFPAQQVLYSVMNLHF
jgi:hypothetical protein